MAYTTTPHLQANTPVVPHTPPVAAGPDWQCGKCKAALTIPEIQTRAVGATTFLQCPHCAGPVNCTMAPPERLTFYEKITQSILYPVRGWATVLLLFGTIMLWATEFAVHWSLRAIPVYLALLGYIFAWTMSIINTTADGDDVLPDWPGVTVGLIRNFFMFIATTIFCFLPTVLYLVAAFKFGLPFKFIVFPLFLGFWLLPMATLRVAMFATVEALHPADLVQSIFKVNTAYTCACMIFFFLMYLNVALAVLLAQVPFIGGMIGVFIRLYLLVVEARILGTLYYAYQEKFDWFSDYA